MSISHIPKPGLPIAPHVRRIMDEGDELAKKLGALHAFTATDAFKALAALDAHMLTLQAEVMQSYLHILTIRLARANDAVNGIIPDNARALNKIKTGKLDLN